VLVVVDAKEVAQGYRTSELTGEEVLHDARQEIGEIDDFVVSADGENPEIFAILEVGGFLGLGGYLVAVPFESLDLDDPSGEIVLKGATQEALEGLPEFEYGS
jgi:PRC-barrel domain